MKHSALSVPLLLCSLGLLPGVAQETVHYDNIRTKDGSVDQATFSYNTGTMLESHVCLYECTGDQRYLDEAIAIADSSLAFFYGRGRFRDGYWFNAVLLRAYLHLLNHNSDLKYIRGFQRCLDHALARDRNEQGLFKGRNGTQNLVEQGGMLEILARFAWLENRHALTETGGAEAAVPQR